MTKLDWMVGDWEGKAKFDAPAGRSLELRQTERVRKKVDGRVLVIEGTGRMKDAEGNERVVFEALATLSYDPAAGKYIMRAHSREGTVDPTFEVREDSIVWGFAPPGGPQIRYTIRRDERGHWVESGERSMDQGLTWIPFLEMDLEKKDAAEEP